MLKEKFTVTKNDIANNMDILEARHFLESALLRIQNGQDISVEINVYDGGIPKPVTRGFINKQNAALLNDIAGLLSVLHDMQMETTSELIYTKDE